MLSRLDELAKKIIFFNGLQTRAERALFRMLQLLETCAKLLKLTERIGDDECQNKRAKEGLSTKESSKHSKRKLNWHAWIKSKHCRNPNDALEFQLVFEDSPFNTQSIT